MHSTIAKLEHIHADLWGPNIVSSEDGAMYSMTMIDDYSQMIWVYFLKNNDEAFLIFARQKTLVEKQSGKRVKHL